MRIFSSAGNFLRLAWPGGSTAAPSLLGARQPCPSAALAWAVQQGLHGELALLVDGYEQYLARLRLNLLGSRQEPSDRRIAP